MTTASRDYTVKLRSSTAPDGRKHELQEAFVNSECKRVAIKAGRRGGKTVGIAKKHVKRFLKGRRQLYAAPTNTQVDTFWFEVKRALKEPLEAGVYKKDESERYIELPGTKQRIKAKTAWNAETMRGDYGDDVTLDEFQLMNEDALDQVVYPMLIDNNGSLTLIHTPPSLHSAGVSKARDPRHASKQFKKAMADDRWETYHFTSHDNPFISHEALEDITKDMSMDSYRREIMAEDDEIEDSWLVYSVFNEKKCKIQPINIDPKWPVYSYHDFGSANPAALFMAVMMDDKPVMTSTGGAIHKGDHIIFREYCPGGGRSTFEHVQEWESWGYYYESSRNKNTTMTYSVGGNQNTEDEIREAYKMHGWPIHAPRIKHVKVQIDRVKGVMELDKLWIFDTCWGLLSEISNCMWKLDKENKPTDVINDEAKYHRLACLRYGESEFPPETITNTGPIKAWLY